MRLGQGTLEKLVVGGVEVERLLVGGVEVWSASSSNPRTVTVQSVRDPWGAADMDGWAKGSETGDLEIFDKYDYLDYEGEGIVWDLRFTVPVTCSVPLLGTTPEIVYSANAVIPAGEDINPPVPSQPTYTFTEVLGG